MKISQNFLVWDLEF